jgi:hypothetical protein
VAIPMVMANPMVMAIVGDPRRCDRRAASITGHHVAMMRRSATDTMHEGSPHRHQPHEYSGNVAAFSEFGTHGLSFRRVP